ncbi:MAG: hypothetical protein GF418_13700 [Chitinivibrionales bacterium]|nr:hypothetical protein [Chitinivibrionales bacterium]MBD3396675.1 hypothetical protein [Chitinivibrionales bacterium]
MRIRCLAVLSFLLALGLAQPARARKSIAEKHGETFAKELAGHVEKLTDAYPTMKGSLKLAITVNADGWVSLVEPEDNRLSDTEPLAAMLEKVYAWEFSPLDIEQQNVVVEHTIRFSDELDTTRVFFVVMGVLMATIAGLIVFVRVR